MKQPKKKQQQFRIVNKLTGEVMDFAYSDIHDAESVYLEIKSMLDILTRAKGRVLEYISKQVDELIEFEDGYTGRWVHPVKKKYRPDVIRRYLDEDQLSLVLEVNGEKLKELLEQLVKDGKGISGAWEDIEANAERTPIKSYFAIKRSTL